MSEIDFKRYGKIAKSFENHPLNFIVATNSLKIQLCSSKGRGKPYIWIDPSWELFQHGRSIVSSSNYPDNEAPLYIHKHRAWCKKFPVVDGAMLLSVKLNKYKQTVFRFSKDMEIVSYGYNLELLNGETYDGWYAFNN